MSLQILRTLVFLSLLAPLLAWQQIPEFYFLVVWLSFVPSVVWSRQLL